MKTMAGTEFKAHALRVLDGVAKRRESVIVTKRGKPVAEIIPYAEPKPQAGSLADTLVSEGDIISPLGADLWDAAR